jgi:hypothetical protein
MIVPIKILFSEECCMHKRNGCYLQTNSSWWIPIPHDLSSVIGLRNPLPIQSRTSKCRIWDTSIWASSFISLLHNNDNFSDWAYIVSVIAVNEDYVALVEWYRQEKAEVLGEKPVPVSFCPSQIPHGLAWGWTRVSAVTARRPTRQPQNSVSNFHCCLKTGWKLRRLHAKALKGGDWVGWQTTYRQHG